MNRLAFSLIILCFLSGCVFGGFDVANIRGGLFRAPPDAPEILRDQVKWEDYNDDMEFKEGCVLIYVKHNLSCGDCTVMDETFKDKKVVSILNHNFITIKASDDLPDGEMAIAKLEGLTPGISIVAGGYPPNVLFYHDTSAIPIRAFTGILTETLRECNDYHNSQSRR